MIELRTLPLAGLLALRPDRIVDERGDFSEVWRDDVMKGRGIDADFVQDNHVRSPRRGILRGMHFQRPPFAQAKLVRAVAGSIFDVAIDLRRDSPTFGRWTALTLSADNGLQMFVPAGFAHGYVTLEDGTEVIYKVSAPWHRSSEGAVAHDDPSVAIAWPVAAEDRILSDRDRAAPPLPLAAIPDRW